MLFGYQAADDVTTPAPDPRVSSGAEVKITDS